MAFYQFIREQKIPAGIDEIWEFISSPSNLKKITPEYMGFDITSGALPEKMYEGMIITYKVSPVAGIKTDWMTEITHIREKQFFVDEQRVGPYKLWHHQHHIIPIKGGVLMRDIVTYAPPFGFFGSIANKLMIQKKLEEIFRYRFNRIIDLFGNYDSKKL